MIKGRRGSKGKEVGGVGGGQGGAREGVTKRNLSARWWDAQKIC